MSEKNAVFLNFDCHAMQSVAADVIMSSVLARYVLTMSHVTQSVAHGRVGKL